MFVNYDGCALEQWYTIKPFAERIFGNYKFEIIWLRKVWCLLHALLPEKEFPAMEYDERETLPVEACTWLLALYDILLDFKYAVDLGEGESRDYAYWAERMGHDISSLQGEGKDSFDEDAFIKYDILPRQTVFKQLVMQHCAGDAQRMIDFMTNEDVALTAVEFENCYIALHEDKLDDADDYNPGLEEDLFVEYRQRTVFEPQASNAYSILLEWVSEFFREPREDEDIE